MPVNFVIHEIARTDKGRHQSYRHHQSVESEKHAATSHPTRINPNGDENTYRSAMTGQPPFPDFQYLDGVLRIEIPLIKQTVPQTRPQHHADNDINKQRVEPFHIQLLMTVHTLHHAVTHDKANSKKESVPAYLDSSVV